MEQVVSIKDFLEKRVLRKKRILRDVRHIEIIACPVPFSREITPYNNLFNKHYHVLMKKNVYVQIYQFVVHAVYKDGRRRFVCSARTAEYDGTINVIFDYMVSLEYRDLGFHQIITAARAIISCFSVDEEKNCEMIASFHPLYGVPKEKIIDIGGRPIEDAPFDSLIRRFRDRIFMETKDDDLDYIKDTIFVFDKNSMSDIIMPVVENLADARFVIKECSSLIDVPIIYSGCHILNGDPDEVYDHIVKRVNSL